MSKNTDGLLNFAVENAISAIRDLDQRAPPASHPPSIERTIHSTLEEDGTWRVWIDRRIIPDGASQALQFRMFPTVEYVPHRFQEIIDKAKETCSGHYRSSDCVYRVTGDGLEILVPFGANEIKSIDVQFKN